MSESQTASAFQARLRAATKHHHHRIDHHPLLAPLLSAQMSQAQYLRILQTLYWFHAPLQTELEEACAKYQDPPCFQPSDRRNWLQCDFEFFGIDTVVIDNPLRAWHGPAISGPAELIGALYVVEGSTLGGQFIARALREHFSFGPASGARLFNGHEGGTMERWASFWRYAEQCPETQWPRAEATAAGLFDTLFESLDRAAAYWGVSHS